MNSLQASQPLHSPIQLYQAITSPQSEAFLTDIRKKTAELVEMGVSSGHLDVHDFQAALYQAFGSESHGIVKADDSIDYEKLDDFMGGTIAKKRQELLSMFDSVTDKKGSQLLSYLNQSQNKQFDNLFSISA